MSIVQSKLEELEKFHRAAYLEFKVGEEFGNSPLPQLIQLLGYRQRVAQEVIKSGYSEETINLFDYTNDQIKKLLAI